MATHVNVSHRIVQDMKDTVDALKNRTGWTDEELGKRCGVSSRTIYNLKYRPTAVNGGLVLMVQDLLKQENKKLGR